MSPQFTCHAVLLSGLKTVPRAEDKIILEKLDWVALTLILIIFPISPNYLDTEF